MRLNRICCIGLLCILFSLTCCNSKVEDKIILTSGFSMNPQTARIGIEIKGDSLFYCEEIVETPGRYKYFYCLVDKEKSYKILNKLKNKFTGDKKFVAEVDATIYQLLLISKGDTTKTNFHRDYIDAESNNLIDQLFELKKCDLSVKSYHYFPSELLQSKLPPPPKVFK
jgi:hypothetical protein